MTTLSALPGLFGTASSRPNRLNDLITGGSHGILQAAGNSLSKSSLAPVQSSALKNLKDYVSDNVANKGVLAKLQSDIAAIESFMLRGSQDSQFMDPAFALLALNPLAFSGLQPGSVVNQQI